MSTDLKMALNIEHYIKNNVEYMNAILKTTSDIKRNIKNNVEHRKQY